MYLVAAAACVVGVMALLGTIAALSTSSSPAPAGERAAERVLPPLPGTPLDLEEAGAIPELRAERRPQQRRTTSRTRRAPARR
ncbi:MAG: hypothetical protein AVDCRST_MAG13-1506, partial [uncultured Solirubrobacteraceae bacterium]